MSNHFQIAVLGSGPGGYVAALKAAQMGARTAVIERRPFFGGTCLNFGCIPSKALLASAELLHHIERAKAFGIQVGGPVTADWSAIQKRKDRVVAGLRGGIKGLFAARRIETFQGFGRLDGPGRIVVAAEDGSTETVTADRVILAPGSEPMRIPGWPTDPERVCTSDEALHWDTLPERLLIVGGGVIGLEFVCMMQPLGVAVTVVEMMPNLLPGLDGELADGLGAALAARGVALHTDTKVESMELAGDGVRATLSNGETIETDRVLVAAGRRAATSDIGLDSVGIETDRGFIRVDDTMATPVKDHYCIGDANGRCLLAHAASAHGVTAVENALGQKTVFDAPIPGCVYTFPEIGAVGLTTEEARERAIPITIGRFPLGHLGKAMAVGDTEGFVKVIRHRETDALLGVHMMGHNATEVIAAAGALLHQKVTVTDVAETVFAHPTIGEAVKEASEDALGAALHLPPRKVLRVTAGA